MVKAKPSTFLATIVTVASLLTNTSAFAQESSKSVKIIEPNNSITKAESAAIDSENFEAGIYGGFLSVEDFNTNPIFGLDFTYHINNDFKVSFQTATSEVGRATFEDVLGGSFLSDADRKFEYTGLIGGYRLFHGRSYSNEKSKYNSNIYLLFGASSIDFAGNSETGLVIGSSYKTVITDWLTWDLTIKDHIVDRTFLDSSKKTHNIEFSLGLNALF
ncbi:outer membrane beta-barrel domain-containing protein [Pleionea sediminis]|uniref:outer membrane beta-barrel domain-containing protein n=1 Tax=Pleionea sediminis TaxID=2569479 RepID=UPI0011848B97|nr:outer membrane beta-barrel domain-containing protein [Pleionea sediminis]